MQSRKTPALPSFAEKRSSTYAKARYAKFKLSRIAHSTFMAITEHPPTGSLLMCDFTQGFRPPEMIKHRLVVVLSPKIRGRPGLCTVVALSTTPPIPEMPYHCTIDIRPRLPAHFQSDGIWVKGDMIYAAGFHRLDFIRRGKDATGKRLYYNHLISREDMNRIRACVLSGIGLSNLTKHLASHTSKT